MSVDWKNLWLKVKGKSKQFLFDIKPNVAINNIVKPDAKLYG